MSDQSITSRPRRHRGTRWTVYLADRVAKWLIVAGGIGTIVAVSLVCVFLVSVVAPLFMAARVAPPVESRWPPPATAGPASAPVASNQAGDQPPADLGQAAISPPHGGHQNDQIVLDDYANAAIVLSPDGRARLIELKGGVLVDEQSLASGQEITTLALDQQSSAALVGFANGDVRLAAVRFETEFLDLNRLPASLAELPIGDSTPWERRLATRVSSDQFRVEGLSVRLEAAIPLQLSGRVRRVDFVKRSQDLLIAALTDDGQLRTAEVTRRENELNGEVDFEVGSSASIAWRDHLDRRDAPDEMLVSGLGDSVYLAWKDGELLRFFTGDLKHPRLAEKRDLAPEPQAALTALGFAVGRATLLAGDSTGAMRAWFLAKPEGLDTPDRAMLVCAHEFAATGSAVTRLAASQRGRSVAIGHADGLIQIVYLTTERLLAEMRVGDASGATPGGPPGANRQADQRGVTALALAPRDDLVVALAPGRMVRWGVDSGSPEVNFRALFLPVWYEGYAAPSYAWQSSSGSEGSEPKLSLIPLIFGTFKATLYAMLFGAPLALCGAIYTSEFMRPELKAKIKPVIEMMASLPSVVLGYIAGLILAPFTDHALATVVATLYTTPLACLTAAHLWQLLPQPWTLALSRWRLLLILATAPLGVALGVVVGPWAERLLFAGDMRAWLDGEVASPFGGWVVLLIPPAALASVWGISTLNAALRSHLYSWDRNRRAWLDAGKFVLACAATLAGAWLLSATLTSLGFDPRGGLVGSYVQRNALIVGFVMGFAIIPLIFTIADDAMSTVPEHLRSASLGAGATPWQTATRIIIPTAMSGLFSALMIGLGRAVGETMIVLMAAGNTPIMDWNIFNGFQTLSAMVATEASEAVQGGSFYRTIFFAALTLFLLTFVLNTVAELVRLRFRRRAYEL